MHPHAERLLSPRAHRSSPCGVMVHSTGANNPYLRRYVQPDDGELGKNRYDND